jgi:uncharacterized protein
MSEGLPAFIEPIRLAEQARGFAGKLPLGRFRRLAESLADTSGQVEVELAFAMEPRGRARVSGRARAVLHLVCQRCLEPLEQSLEVAIHLVVVRSDAEAARLDEGEDPLLVGEDPIPLVEMIEDELLLALPQVPLHPPSVCSARDVAGAGARTGSGGGGAFASLARLRSERGGREEG